MLERSLELSGEELRQANTEMLRAVAALQEARAELETRVEERTKALTTAEAQLRQAQKMEAIGRLAGGVAHDFNNLLTVIFGEVELLLEMHRRTEADPSIHEGLGGIQKAAESAASLTRQLLAFSRQQALTPTTVDVNELARNTTTMLRRVIGEDIELVIDLQPGVGSVRADVGQLQQVLLNLGLNARDAMPEGGKMTISTSVVVVEPSEGAGPTTAGTRPGAYVALKVSDTGVGMDTHVKARIFEPFFTTKELHRGTGLGLATVYGIVKQSDGYIDVSSVPGSGTSFQVLLPHVHGIRGVGCAARRSSRGSGMVPRRGPGRRPPRHQQVTCGARDTRCSRLRNGRSALEIAQKNGAIDLLLTDVVMPQMNGRRWPRGSSRRALTSRCST